MSAGALHVIDVATGADRILADPDGQARLGYGLAEFIAAEEMGRLRGYWWAPDGSAILTARVDESPVQRWHIADPARPDRPAADIGYPAAGTANADVSLLFARLDGSQAEVRWDRAEFPYLVTVSWAGGRRRGRAAARGAEPGPAPDAAAPGRPGHRGDHADPRGHRPEVAGHRARGARQDQRRADRLDGGRRPRSPPAARHRGRAPDRAPPRAVTPATLQVRDVLGTDGNTVLFTASGNDPAEIGLWLYRNETGLQQLSPPGGVHGGTRSGGTTVLVSRTLADPGPAVQILQDTRTPARTADIEVRAEQPSLPAPEPDLFPAGPEQIRCALLLPSWHRPGTARLPVLLDPYGGPHAQRVLAAQSAFHTSQWLAEQGFAVLVADGRGTPGRGPDWDRAVWHDLADPVLEDQVTALYAAAERHEDLDLSRVAIRGWSFGGYLAALAVLRRPDVFHAAVAGAPVTDWTLYDTHYTERYLGNPAQDPAPYQHCSLISEAAKLSRPLMLIHGLADDNVVVAHTLRLSGALLAAGRPHSVLPLSGVTHMTPQEEVAENLLLLQVDFLYQALGMDPAQGEAHGKQAM